MEKKQPNLEPQKEESTQLFKVIDVPNSPFKIIEKEGENIIVLGDKAVAKPFNNIEEALTYINNKSWELLTTVIIIINELLNNKENGN